MAHDQGDRKSLRGAISVCTPKPIHACYGIFYYEIKILKKSRHGNIGIGFATQGFNVNKIPGSCTYSYGYHANNGQAYQFSHHGQPYGPTFTTGDIIGCGINLVDSNAFFTKNGTNLGTVFTKLPSQLYAVVGLETPREEVEINLGKMPFIFDIENMRKELRARTQLTVERIHVPEEKSTLNKLIFTYLAHNGYSATAQIFSKNTGQVFTEEMISMNNRRGIMKLVLAGRMGEAIETTNKLYPGLLRRDMNLLFLLKFRQFVEMSTELDTESTTPPRTFIVQSEVDDVEKMNITTISNRRQLSGGSNPAVERILELGRELYRLNEQIQEKEKNIFTQEMLKNAFSLLAYADPLNSPMGWQLIPMQREVVCAELNSKIMEYIKFPRRSPLEVAMAHAQELVKLMCRSGLGSSGFAGIY